MAFFRAHRPAAGGQVLPAIIGALTKDGVPFVVWTDHHQECVERLRAMLAARPVLIPARKDAEFYVVTDASQYALAGAVMMMKTDTYAGGAVMYISRVCCPRASGTSYTHGDTTTRKGWRALAFTPRPQKLLGFFRGDLPNLLFISFLYLLRLSCLPLSSLCSLATIRQQRAS